MNSAIIVWQPLMEWRLPHSKKRCPLCGGNMYPIGFETGDISFSGWTCVSGDYDQWNSPRVIEKAKAA